MEKLDVYNKAIDFYCKASKLTQNFSRGSAFECVPILEICKRQNLIDAVTCQSLTQELETICKMLYGLIDKKEN